MPDMLLIEDNDLDVDLVELTLKEAGIDCCLHVARDGAQAQALLARVGVDLAPTLVVIDLGIPRADGLGLIAQIRAHPRLRTVPLVVFSGSINPQDRQAALRLGASEFIAKPSDYLGYVAIGRRLAGLALAGSAGS